MIATTKPPTTATATRRPPSIRNAAIAARAAGLSVLPPLEDGSKAPGCGKWKRRQSVPSTLDEIHGWYPEGESPHTGLGVVCGKVSGNLEMFEFDAGGEAYEPFKDAAVALGLGDLVGRLDGSYRERTPSGGIHWFYRCPEIAGNTVLAKYDGGEVNKYGKPILHPLIETRGEGGYAVLAPSHGKVHPTGGAYELLSGDYASIPTITPDEREALWNLARSFDRDPQIREEEIATPAEVRPSGSQGGDWADAVTPWDDYNARAHWADLLHGWSLIWTDREVQYWRRPGKKIGHSATINRHGSDRLYVFSSSTDFETRKPYTKAQAYARIKHGGDYTAATRALSLEGYGTFTTWVPDGVGWKLEIRQNPCPKGVRIARQGEGPPVTILEWGKTSTPPPRDVVGASSDGGGEGEGEDTEVVDRWPTIDPRAFHGIAGEIVDLADPHSEADRVGTLVQILLAFANMAGRNSYWVAGATKHYLNMYAVLVGMTALGRKGTSWDIARWILENVDPDWARHRIQSGLVSGEGLIHHVRDKIEEEKEVKSKSGPPTIEKVVVDKGVEDKRLLIVETEFSRALKAGNRESNTLTDVVRQAFDSGSLRTLGKNSPVAATGAHISIIGHVTQADVARHLTATDSANGFANRFLWVAVRRSKVLPEGGDLFSVDWTPIHNRMRRIVDFVRRPDTARRMVRNATAKKMWAGVYGQLSGGRVGLLGSILSRGEVLTMRLACVYALLDGSDEVGPEHLAAALALWDYCERSARLVFAGAAGLSDEEKILARLSDAPEGLSRKAVSAVFGANRKRGEITAILSELLTAGLIHRRVEHHGGRGRPTEIWFSGGAGN